VTNADGRGRFRYQPFLRPVGGEDRAWGDTVWLTQLLNEEGVKIGEPPVRRDNVLQATRTAMKKLGETHRLNFQEISYADKYGRSQPGREAMGAALPPAVVGSTIRTSIR
jgi:hypothetical protein